MATEVTTDVATEVATEVAVEVEVEAVAMGRARVRVGSSQGPKGQEGH